VQPERHRPVRTKCRKNPRKTSRRDNRMPRRVALRRKTGTAIN
jgi:hypothetical protein